MHPVALLMLCAVVYEFQDFLPSLQANVAAAFQSQGAVKLLQTRHSLKQALLIPTLSARAAKLVPVSYN